MGEVLYLESDLVANMSKLPITWTSCFGHFCQKV